MACRSGATDRLGSIPLSLYRFCVRSIFVPVFSLQAPVGAARPLLVEVPHAGLAIPEALVDEITVSERAVERDADIYVDLLYRDAPALGASFLVANTSRYVVDLNRAAADTDAETVADHPNPRAHRARGVVWRTTTDGDACLYRPLTYTQFQERIETYYTPYHRALADEMMAMRERAGYAILLAAHSMPSVGRAGHSDTGAKRADVVPGTQGRTTASSNIIDLVDSHFRHHGLSVEHDQPYRGGWSTQNYGRPSEGWHAIQIELNRALYVNEQNGEPKDGEFEALRAILAELVDKLAQITP